ncbi:MAG: S8/S53 family peptidase [Chitinophagaceae bacterium]
MKARVTVYVDPQQRQEAINSLKSTLGDDISFLSDDSRYLSWVGEGEIEVQSQKEAFLLERDLQKIQPLSDIEIVAEDTPEEEEINFRHMQVNESINEGKTQFPHPAWFRHAIKLDDALQYATDEFKAGRGFFNPADSKCSIGLIDTGYSDHPEVSRINRKLGRNFLRGEDANDPLDTLESTRPIPLRWGGHGTSCAGLQVGTNAIILPENRLPHKNVYYDDLVNGLLPENLDVIPFRVSKNILSFGSRMAHAINHIVDDGTIPVISMSHASLLNRKIYYAATREAYEKGILFMAAPGSHIFASRRVLTYPAKYMETISPAASTVNNVPWKLTHGGPEVDLCAPGYEIYIPWPFKNKSGQLGYVYKWSEGSSFAVPIVAVAAALWTMHHGSKLNGIPRIQLVELFRTAIKKTATPFTGEVEPGLYGSGVINFHKMLQYPLPKIKEKLTESFAKPSMSPEKMFATNKKQTSVMRELSYLKTRQFVTNQAKSVAEEEFYHEQGTEELKGWLNKKTIDKAEKTEHIDSMLETFLTKHTKGARK